MTFAAPEVVASLLTPHLFAPIPLRYIGKHPVFADEHGEYVLMFIKITNPNTKVTEEQQFKVDANINIMRNAYALTLANMQDKGFKAKKVQRETSLGFIVYQNLNNKTVAGETSLPRALFGKDYHYARHTRDDDHDIRMAAFQKTEKKAAKTKA